MADTEKKKLNDLRVVDLKSELERRSLEVTGVKTVLMERLNQAIRDEGHDPEEYLFEINVGKGKVGKPATPVKATREADKAVEEAAAEEPAVAEEDASNNNNNSAIDEDELIIKDDIDQDDCFEEVDRIGEIEKEENQEDLKSKVANKKEEVKADDNIETSNIDNEDSLNLTIGEEEEQLLHDEENDVKSKELENNLNPTPVESDKKPEEIQEEVTTEKAKTESDTKVSTTIKTSGKEEVPAATTSVVSTQNNNSPSTVKTKITAPSPSTPAVSNVLSRNLWVSGLSSLSRATDLKQLFSKYGKVIGAKVVTNTRTPGQRCFGYVTMANAKDATECINNLHRTELHGRMISVERAKSDLGPPKSNGSTASAVKPAETKGSTNSSATSEKKKESDSSSKKVVTSKDSERKDSRKSTADDKSRDRKKDDGKNSASTNTSTKPERKRISPPRSDSKDKVKPKPREPRPVENVGRPKIRSKSPIRKKSEHEIMTYNKIREARERQRLKEKERELREEERRRHEIRRRQREEEQRLAREREKLAIERRRIEAQKAELLRIERERQKLERDKIELERLELKRQQRKIEEAKRAIKRPISNDRYDDDRDRDRKRSTVDSRRFDIPPPPPRFDTAPISRSSNYDRDRGTSDIKKRLDDFPSKRDDSYSSSKRDSYKSSRDDFKRDLDIPRHASSSSFSSSARIESSSSLVKDRYSDRSTSDYRSNISRSDDREPRNGSSKPRYLEPPAVDIRFSDRPAMPSSGAWNSGATSHQSFGVNAGGIWAEKQQADSNSSAWRMEDNRYDRKVVIPTAQFVNTPRDPFIGSTSITPNVGRFGGNNRYDNGRF